MIPNTKLRVVTSQGVTESSVFGISMKDASHIMQILRDTLYSDKVLAVIREYSSNAWDAHKEMGKGNLPIKVIMPTLTDPALTIRDFGPGLSQNDVFEVYTQYGASTKRGSDSSVGMLGIGSKSGFAYSDSFTVTSWHGGSKKTYVAVLDASEKGLINLLHEEDCPDTETGVQIQIAVRPEDISEFEQKAKQLFQYFDPRPDINLTLPPLPSVRMRLKNGVIYEREHYNDHGNWVAVMGCVPYRINLDQLVGPNGSRVADYISNISGALYFGIGEVQISASREELKYSTTTKDMLVRKFELVVDEYVQHAIDSINSGNFTPWERRVKAQVLRHLHLPIPKDWKETAEGSIRWDSLPDDFIIQQDRTHSTDLNVAERTRLLIRDDGRSLMGYGLTHFDYVVYPGENIPIDKVKEALEAWVKKKGLEGIPIQLISTLPWVLPKKTKSGKTINIKHKVRTFKLKDQGHYNHPWSACWEIEKREATTEDVYVLLHNFKAPGGFDVFSAYREDKALAKSFNMPMPTIYGYKIIEKNPVDQSKILGKHYRDWRNEFIKALVAIPEVKEKLELFLWGKYFGDSYSWRYDDHPKTRRRSDAEKLLTEKLGPDHALTNIVCSHNNGRVFLGKNKELWNSLETLVKRSEMPEPPKLAIEALHQKYPLLSLAHIPLENVWGDDHEPWLHYIKIIDTIHAQEKTP